MICSNPECKKEYIPKRSDSKSCSTYCAKRNKYLKRADYYKSYLKEYRKRTFEQRRDYNLARGKIYYQKNKDIINAKTKLYNENNKDKVKEIRRKSKLKNKENISLQNKLYRIKNAEKVKRAISNWAKKNKARRRMSVAKRRALKLKATPKFANLEKIKEIYLNCPKGYHVDHIVPLQGKNVCGLHVEWNLQYLTPYDNKSKSNKLIV
jgi:hypothetical protein